MTLPKIGWLTRWGSQDQRCFTLKRGNTIRQPVLAHKVAKALNSSIEEAFEIKDRPFDRESDHCRAQRRACRSPADVLKW